MTATLSKYAEQVYAGVLGKIIGVYLGRPVEGWPYLEIKRKFGEVAEYVCDDLAVPLIVADDDISGTFAFFRALEDNGYPHDLQAYQVGQTWLNYIVEDKTVLWWGGLGRSTEHTAFLRLKSGVLAPQSGSAALNGVTLSSQVGAQIFSDAFAMALPADPQRAAELTRRAASVSHDGIAVDATGFLAAMRSQAFIERDLESLVDECLRYVQTPELHAIVEDVVARCQEAISWREIRDWVDAKYGYSKYPGPCHIIPNHAMTLVALLLGGDNFQRSVMIASSAGFDTDSNAGSVGCLNGIRLGLDALTSARNLRSPVADRMLVVTSDGGGCVTDAVREAQRIVRAGEALRGEVLPPNPRFNFAFRGSTQGFEACPYLRVVGSDFHLTNQGGKAAGLKLSWSIHNGGPVAIVSTPVFLDPADAISNFSTMASPTLYAGQTIKAHVSATTPGTTLRCFVLLETDTGDVDAIRSEAWKVESSGTTVSWKIPSTGNLPLFRLGFEFTSPTDGSATIDYVDWASSPTSYGQSGIMLSSIWDTAPAALQSWVSSAKNFEADFDYTYSVSHPELLGVATHGSTDWADYSVASTLRMSIHETAGLVARSRGHRRFYAAVFSGGNAVSLIKQLNNTRQVMATTDFAYGQDEPYHVSLECNVDTLSMTVNGRPVLQTQDRNEPFLSGAAGFLIEQGTFLADGLTISSAATAVPS